MTRQKIEDDHLPGKCLQTIEKNGRFLLDSGSDLNLINISALRDDVIVYDHIVYELKGITEHFIRTLGFTNLDIKFGSEVCTIEFQIEQADFHKGILRKPFIIGQGVIINYRTTELIFTDHSEMTLQPRTETLVAVAAPNLAENSSILIDSQNVTEAITTVKNHSILVSFNNTTENCIQKAVPKFDQFEYEEFNEANVHTIQIQANQETKADSSRINRLQEALRLDHLNSEEKFSLLSVCNEYFDLFFLERDNITATSEITHGMRTSEAICPINEKPYRLPQRHRQEITEQMDTLEREGVIAPSDSPWNASLLVVLKKPDVNGKVKYRVCVDFRRLNQVTVGNAFPFPNVTDILEQLGKSKYYSTLDLAQGYHQVLMNPTDRKKPLFPLTRVTTNFCECPLG